jgi:hypothetical protein
VSRPAATVLEIIARRIAAGIKKFFMMRSFTRQAALSDCTVIFTDMTGQM